MHIANPNALWLLGLIPVVILIHYLRTKPKTMMVTTLFLMESAHFDKGGGIGLITFLKSHLLLLLQIVVILMAVLALAEPFGIYPDHFAYSSVIIVDTSASMKTMTEKGRCFFLAQKKAHTLVDGLPKGSETLLIEAGRRPIVSSEFTSDKKALKRKIDSLFPKDVPGDLEKAVFLAISLMDAQSRDRLFIITDGAIPFMDKVVALYPYTQSVMVEKGRDNVGITQFSFRRESQVKHRYQIFIAIKNFNDREVICPVQLFMDRSEVMKKKVSLKPKEMRRFILTYEGLISGTAILKLARDDDLMVDNIAYSVMNDKEDIWVLLVSSGNFYLEQLLSSYPNIKVNQIEKIDPESFQDQATANDVVILDGVDFPKVDAGNFLMVNSFSPSIPIKKNGRVQNIRITDWAREHALMAHLDFTRLKIDQASRIRTGKKVDSLLGSETSDMMCAYEKDRIKAFFIGFDLADSDLPLRVAFPVLFGNIFNWLYPNRLEESLNQTTAGERYSIPFPPGTSAIKVKTPKGRWQSFDVTASPFIYTNTNEVGLYTLLENGRRRVFAVNFLNESESDIFSAPLGEKLITPLKAEQDISKGRLNKAFWPLFILFAGGVLLIEWYFYMKRSLS